MPKQDLDLVSKLTPEQLAVKRFQMTCFSPDDGKYGDSGQPLVKYLTPDAELRTCAFIQKVLLETRVKFGQAQQSNLDELVAALEKFDPLNVALIEADRTLKIEHDQLAVLAELGRYVSEATAALLHPGTTSYDILDTARSYLFKKAWFEVIRPEVGKSIKKLCEIAEKAGTTLQVGRTHLQDTSPVPLQTTFALYAARLAERVRKCDLYFNDLRGKCSGIVGTGASVDMVIGDGKSIEFEETFLKKLGLKPDYTATQILQKERTADVGHGLTTLVAVLFDFADDIRKMYASSIKEATSRDNAERLGGSSADAMKNNPIQLENICGTNPIVMSGMIILYSMIQTDFQRDLIGSKPARYQPQGMMVETYETFSRLNKTLKQLSINEDRLAQNLEFVRRNPSEAMTAILRGAGFVHPVYGVGHDFVKEVGKTALKEGRPLLGVAMEDLLFANLVDSLYENKKRILAGQLELYTGSAYQRAESNIAFARTVANRYGGR